MILVSFIHLPFGLGPDGFLQSRIHFEFNLEHPVFQPPAVVRLESELKYFSLIGPKISFFGDSVLESRTFLGEHPSPRPFDTPSFPSRS